MSSDSRKLAKKLIDKGLRPVPIPRGEKAPVDRGWPKREHKPSDFRPTDNIGIHLGPSGLVDVDLDSPEAIAAAPHLLPETFLIHGRPGKPNSHYWYRATAKQRKYLDPIRTNSKTATLVELRAGEGLQTVIPPSVYQVNGKAEMLAWSSKGKAASPETKELERAVAAVAAAALLARHWPTGARQDCALALAGGLLKGGHPLAFVQSFVRAVCAAAGDEEAEKRVDAVARTGGKLAARESVVGIPSLQQAMPREVVSRALDWLGDSVPVAADEDERAEPDTSMPTFPSQVLRGLAGDFANAYAKGREVPASFLFFSFMSFLGALTSGRVTMPGYPDPRLYCALLGASGRTKKSTALELAYAFWSAAWPAVRDGAGGEPPLVLHGLGSGEGVAREVEARHGKMLVLLDELRLLTDKARQEGSTLLSLFSRLFEGHDWSNTTVGKNSKPIVLADAHLSLLGASTLGTFAIMWSEHFLALGFMNRLFFVVDDVTKAVPTPTDPPAATVTSLVQRVQALMTGIHDASRRNPMGRVYLRMTREAERRFDDWYLHAFRPRQDDAAVRLDTYAKRLMLLLAMCDDARPSHLDAVSEQNVADALALVEYQYAVRTRYAPVDVETRAARLEGAIQRELAGRRSRRASWRDLYRNVNGNRFGSGMFSSVVGHMVDAGILRVYGDRPKLVELLAEEA
jgi:hypothetical protein